MDAVEEIKQRLSIEDVISEYVELKRAGRNFKGLSPFNTEKTPSFMVSPEKGIWHDFSSGKGGDMFSFVMEMEGLDFRAALEHLARKAGVDLEQFRGSGNSGKLKERLFAALDLAAKFYQTQFANNPQALEYVLKKRAFTKQTALDWRLGYSPNNGTALVDFLKKQGFNEQEIKQAGLSAQRYRGLGDMFRGRIMIPLCDAQGRVIGFTARLLADDPNAPKYINTPQTLLYDKSRHVFGLHFAKEAIRKSKYVVIAEGNLDVISSHQAGVRQVVATAGTALTEPHLKTLSKFTGDIRLSFDADNAGLNATERAIPIASKVGVSLGIVTVPSGKDPDELIRADANTWRSIIEQPVYALDWLMERHKRQLDLTTAEGKRRYSDVILATVRGLGDPVEQEHYLLRIAETVGVSAEALKAKFAGSNGSQITKRKSRPTPAPPTIDAKAIQDQIKSQNHLLALILLRPRLRDVLSDLTEDMFIEDKARMVFVFLRTQPDFAGHADQVSQLKSVADYVKMLSLLHEELYEGLDTIELRYEVERLETQIITKHIKTKKQLIGEQLRTANESEAAALLAEATKLDAQLKQYIGVRRAR